MTRQTTISEIERLMESEDNTPIEILPNGEIRNRVGNDGVEQDY